MLRARQRIQATDNGEQQEADTLNAAVRGCGLWAGARGGEDPTRNGPLGLRGNKSEAARRMEGREWFALTDFVPEFCTRG